jgi:2-C-methyl-D-erythritol 4-phosphate cytidylyltransferase
VSSQDIAVILVAAGRSARFGGDDKLWADLGGRPLIAWPLRTLASLAGVTRVVVVAPDDRHRDVGVLARELAAPVACVAGGARRQDSVAVGLAAAPSAKYYVVHDAARPLVTASLAMRVLGAAREHGAAVPGLPLADTVKRVDGEGRAVETLNRGALRAIQTPQAFEGALLRRAHEQAVASGGDFTDDAAMVEAAGGRVQVVEGDLLAMKVTAPEDLERVRALLRELEARP